MNQRRINKLFGQEFRRLQGFGLAVGLGIVIVPGIPSPAQACEIEAAGIKQAKPPQFLSPKMRPQFMGITRCPSSLNEASQQFQRGDYEAALQLFSVLIEQSPQNAVGWINRAAALDYLGQSSDALRDIDQALSLEMSPAYRTQALSLRQQILSQLEQD